MAYKGMYLKKTVPTDIKEGSWWEEQCIVRQGGYDLDRTNLPATLKFIAKGTVLRLVTGGKAQVVKTAKATEKADKAATTLKIASGSLFQVGDKIAGATISAIASNDGVDTLTVSALDNAVAANAIVSDYDKTKDVLLGFSYDTLDIRDADASIAATPTLQVMEVEEDSLPYPINDEIKAGINANGVALFKVQ